jgi:hypothetical protein
MLVDRPVDDYKFDRTFRCALEGERQGHYQITRLERGAVVWQSDQIGAELSPVFPTMSGNVLGSASGPNETSAILCLNFNKKTEIIWPGDSSLARLAQQCAGANPRVISGPHHGAPKGYQRKSASPLIAAVNPQKAYLSVGTRNKHSHPRQQYILRLEIGRCDVVCSQMTHLCDRDTVAPGLPVVATHLALGLRPPRRGVSCRGVMRLTWNGRAFDTDGFDEMHLDRISALHRAMCLRGRRFRNLLGPDRPKRYRP